MKRKPAMINWKSILFAISAYAAIGFLGLSSFLYNQLVTMQVNNEIAATTNERLIMQAQIITRMQQMTREGLSIRRVSAAELDTAQRP